MSKKYALVVPSWYPTPYNNMAGIFIQKHVQFINTFTKAVVIYPQESTEVKGIQPQAENEYIAYYRKGIIGQLSYLLAFFKAFFYVKRKYGLPYVIHLQVAYPASIVAVALSKWYNIPLIITEHWTGYMDEDGRYNKLSFLMKWFIKKAFALSKKTSVVSNALKQVIVEKRISSPEKIMTVYNTLNIPRPTAIKSHSLATDAPKALTIAHLTDAHKNISMLIEATDLVCKQLTDFKLTIVGGGPESDKFISLAKSKGLLNKNIFFTGYLPNNEVMAEYTKNDFYILSSNFETFSIATAEAIMHGLPVVTTKCGGPDEFINERNGIYIETKDAQNTAKAILQLIDNLSSYNPKQMSEEMREKFSEQKVIAQLKSLYKFDD